MLAWMLGPRTLHGLEVDSFPRRRDISLRRRPWSMLVSSLADTRSSACRIDVPAQSVMGLERRGCVVRPWPRVNWKREEPVDEAKPFKIPKREVWEAFKRVKANQGAAGVDDSRLRSSRPTLRATSTSSGTGCRQGATFLRRCGGSIFQRRMAERDYWVFRRLPIASLRRLSDATWSRSLSRRSTPTPMASGPANQRSMPCTRLASAAGVTTGCSISTSRASSIASIGSFCGKAPFEDGWLGERGLVGEELQAVGVVRGGQLFQEPATEEAREHPDGEKEAGPAGNPALAVWREAAARYDDMGVRMVAPTPTIP